MNLNSKNPNLYFYSAADRVNYGDLLFPIVFKSIGDGIQFENIGVVASDFSKYGAIPTKSFRYFEKKIKKSNGTLIVGGGEVFFASWETLYGFISPVYVKSKGYKLLNRFFRRLNFPSILLSKNNVQIPFVPTSNELNGNLKLIFNAVGGNFSGNILSQRNQIIIDRLKEAEYISVRDKRTQLILARNGIYTVLSPDSALIISDLYPKTILKKISRVKIKYRYLVLQLGKNKAPDDLSSFAKAINLLSKNLGIKVVLCPIGKAPNHEDDFILKKLKECQNSFIYFDPHNIFDVMSIIAHSELFIGTSLHGLITSQSFDVPFVPINPKLGKVVAYNEAWFKDLNSRVIEFDEIDNVFEIIKNWRHYIATEILKNQKNFSLIALLISNQNSRFVLSGITLMLSCCFLVFSIQRF